MTTNLILARAMAGVKKFSLALLIIVAFLALWEAIAHLDNRPDVYFPTLENIVASTFGLRGRTFVATRQTLSNVLLGYVATIVVGILAGIVFAESKIIRQGYMPMVVFFTSLPAAIVAPLFIVWFGLNPLSITLFVAFVGFFPVFINTITGFTHVDDEMIALGSVVGASRWQMIRKIKFWEALPHIATGVKIAIQQAIVGAILAEFIVTGQGLGYSILWASLTARTGYMFGLLFFILGFSYAVFKTADVIITANVPETS